MADSASVRSRFRLVASREHEEWLAGHRPQLGRALLLTGCALALMPLLGVFIGNVWYRMAANAAILVPLAFSTVRLRWRALLTVSARRVGAGALAAAALYGAGAAVSPLLARIPGAAAQVAAVYSWREAAPAGWALPLLLFIILGEEVVWRTAILLPLAARLGAWPGVLVAAAGFAAAHLSLGQPLLMAVALAAGAFWGALVIRSRGIIVPLVSHVLWDLAVLFVRPYGS